MSARDEEHALDLLGARMATAETIVKHHRGRVFKLTGDGMLAEFVSPVEAVRAALEIQEAMRSANANGRSGRPAHAAHRRQSRRRRRKRRRPDGRCRQRRGTPGVDRAARRHLRLGLHLRADHRQAHAGRRGHGRAARQEHPAPHSCLSPDDWRRDTGRRRRLAIGAQVASRLVMSAGAVAAVAIVAIAGAWFLREKPAPVPPPQAAQAPATEPPPPLQQACRVALYGDSRVPAVHAPSVPPLPAPIPAPPPPTPRFMPPPTCRSWATFAAARSKIMRAPRIRKRWR